MQTHEYPKFSCPGKGTNMLTRASVQEDVGRALAMARNLARIYAEVLDEPLPETLRCLIAKWESFDISDGLERG